MNFGNNKTNGDEHNIELHGSTLMVQNLRQSQQSVQLPSDSTQNMLILPSSPFQYDNAV